MRRCFANDREQAFKRELEDAILHEIVVRSTAGDITRFARGKEHIGEQRLVVGRPHG